MADAVASSLGLVAYVAMFAAVAVLFLLANLVVGRFVRPQNPEPEKLEIYECGEPAVGASFVQFDLRFYVVALLFIIFDVEVALVFPWATVFGKAAHLARATPEQLVRVAEDGTISLTDQARGLHEELGVRRPTVPVEVPASLRGAVAREADEAPRAAGIMRHGGQQLAAVALLDMVVFFGVLLVGFAYVWTRGDLNWVRAYRQDQRSEAPPRVGLMQES
jgi:NADH-quinone oxidoreductase subunit A